MERIKILFVIVLLSLGLCEGVISLNSASVGRAADSCVDRCGENYDSSNQCQCNDKCRKYDNCCRDFIPICATEDSCAMRCSEKYNSSLPCHCDDACEQVGNCCDDVTDACGVLTTTSCQNRCQETSKPSNSDCYCDKNCENFGNCCGDFNDYCAVEKYLCKGECNVTRSRCNCTESCLDDKTCCSDYQQTCLRGTAWRDDACADVTELKCPAGYDQSPLILFSIDGFRAEYIYRDLTPNIWKLASCGAHAPYMRSVYPTKTFPNHYTIATGLYPESHGIIDNTIYDHEFQAEFKLGSDESFNPRWWGGEPIWVTTSNQDKISACYFWPGSDVNITRYPDYYFRFNGNVPNEERMYQALEWLDLPQEKRPAFITLYMDIVDHAGHSDGPDSLEVNTQLAIADQMISILMNGLKLRGLENCVNIIMLADHGMAPISCDRKSSLEDYGVNMDVVYSRTGAFGRVGKSKNTDLWDQFNAEETHNTLRCTHDESHWQSFLKYKYLPKRYHYAYNDRIEPVLLTMDDEWLVEGRRNSYTSCNGGTHGYDNEYKTMHALFAGHGPGFKRGYNTTEPFENIEVYNLMADLIDVIPAPNNGTTGSLYHVMSNHKSLAVLPNLSTPEVCDFTTTELDDSCTSCAGLSDGKAQARLQLTGTEVTTSQELNMPYGRPQVAPAGEAEVKDDVSFCMLTQNDYVIAFDKLKKMPFYVSYTLENKERNLVSPGTCARSDPRVPTHTTPCSDYPETGDIVPTRLYPAELSNGDAMHDAAIVTNQVPMYKEAVTVWNYMSLVLAGWASSYGGITVVAGPAFDYNFDGKADTLAMLQQNGAFLNNDVTSVPIPTHFFLVVARCANVGMAIANCMTSPDDLEVLNFIIPNYAVEACHKADAALSDWIPGTLFEHVARTRDVELLTGVSFFPTWTHSQSSNQEQRVSSLRVKLRLPQFTSQWLADFMSTPPPAGGGVGHVVGQSKLALLLVVIFTILLQQ